MTPFLATVMALGGLAAVESLWHGVMQLSADFVLLLVFACVAAPHTLDLGHNARISTLQPFILAAIVLYGVKEAMILSAVSLAYFWLVSRPRLSIVKGMFNLSNFILASWIAGHAYYGVGGRRGDVGSPESLLAMLLAVTVFFAVNTGLVSVAAGLEKAISPSRVWYEKYSWTFTSHLAGGSLVILIGMLRSSLGAQVFFLTAPFCILVYHYLKVYFRESSQHAHRT